MQQLVPVKLVTRLIAHVRDLLVEVMHRVSIARQNQSSADTSDHGHGMKLLTWW